MTFSPYPSCLTLLVLVASVAGLLFWILRRRTFSARILVLTGFVVVLTMAYIATYMPFAPKAQPLLVAEAISSEGFHFCVTQVRTGTAEPFNVAFFYRTPSGPWIWNYLDHEDTFWWKGSIRINEKNKRAMVYKGRSVVASFDWASNVFTCRGHTYPPGSGKPIAVDPLRYRINESRPQ